MNHPTSPASPASPESPSLSPELQPAPDSSPQPAPGSGCYLPPARQVLSPGEWVRAVSDLDAPFGFDGMPTVFG